MNYCSLSLRRTIVQLNYVTKIKSVTQGIEPAGYQRI